MISGVTIALAARDATGMVAVDGVDAAIGVTATPAAFCTSMGPQREDFPAATTLSFLLW